MATKKKLSLHGPLEPLILVIRNQRVILDADLARLYGVATKAFNQAVKRNSERFPEDFAFQLTVSEVTQLRSQTVTSRTAALDSVQEGSNRSQNVTSLNRSQIVTGSQKHRDPRFRPWAFTEHGAVMAANILRSERAVQMSVFVVRAFVRLREHVAANQAILKRLAEIDRTLLQHDTALLDLYEKLLPLLQPPPDPPKRRIGFHSKGKV
jgi:ORF6N domain